MFGVSDPTGGVDSGLMRVSQEAVFTGPHNLQHATIRTTLSA